MSILIFILILLAGYHLLMEGVLIPLFRINIQYRLIALQDELVLLRVRNNKEISDNEFESIKELVSAMEANLPNMNLIRLRFISSHTDEIESREAKKIINTFANHKVIEIRNLFEEAIRCAMRGYLINMLGWFIYALPFLIISILLIVIFHGYKKAKSRLFKILFANNHKKAKEAIVIMTEEQIHFNESRVNGPYTNRIKTHLVS